MYALLLLAPQEASPFGAFGMLVPLLLIFAVFYFFIIRPQKKREDERKRMIEAVRKDDKVVTAGGLHGTVTKVDETSVLVEVATNVKLRIEKSALASVTAKN